MIQCEACLGRGFHWRPLPCSECDGSGLVQGEPPGSQRNAEVRAQIKLRLREPLRAELAAAAERNEVSLNTEVVQRLRASLEAERRPPSLEEALDAWVVHGTPLPPHARQFLARQDSATDQAERQDG